MTEYEKMKERESQAVALNNSQAYATSTISLLEKRQSERPKEKLQNQMNTIMPMEIART